MNRIKQAWLALTGRLEPETVAGPPANVEPVTLYKVRCSPHSSELVFGDPDLSRVWGTYHLSCEAAFAAIGGESLLHVEAEDAVRVGNRYFATHSELKVSKPKRPKGKVRNGR